MLTKTDDCFRCRHCNALPENGMDDRLIKLLNDMGIMAPEINSAYRCEEHNAAVGGVPNSFHVQGIAADIDASAHESVDALAELAEKHGADGIGKYYSQNFVHIDTRQYEARWEE